MNPESIFYLFVLVFSIVLHEISHGYMARVLGDKTAEYEGRLTLNPIKHIDPFGSVILPILTYVSAGITVGWAKPVPYNPYNLKNPKRDEGLIALAGPVSNALIAVIFSLLFNFGGGFFGQTMLHLFGIIVVTNVALGLFNCIPIPPLDGSKILWSILPEPYAGKVRRFTEQYAMVLILFLFLFAGSIVGPLVMRVASFLLS